MIIILVIALVALVGVLAVVGVNGLVGVLLSFVYFIAKWFLTVIDFCQAFMRKLCGLDTVTVNGEKGKDVLFDAVLGNPSIQQALLAILALSVILVFGFALVQIIRLEYTTEGSKNAKGPIIRKCLKSIFLFCLIPFCAFLGIYFSNMLIDVVDDATSGGKDQCIAGQIFLMAAEDANIYRNGKAEWSWCGWDCFGDVITSQIPIISGGDKYDRNTGIITYSDGRTTGGKYKLYVDGGQVVGGDYVHSTLTNADDVDKNFAKTSTSGDPDIRCLRFTRVANDKATSISDGSPINFTNAAAVKYFYNLTEIDFFMLLVPGWFCLKIMVSIVFGLVMRLYKVAVLFVVSPFSVAMTVLDDGASLNKWKSKFLGQTFSAYAVVAGLNIFLMLLPVMKTIEFFDAGEILGVFSSISNLTIIAGSGMIEALFNKLCQMIIILVGCYMIKDIVGIISDLLGVDGNVLSDGEGMSKNIGSAVAKAGSVAMGGLTMAAGAAMAVGGKAVAKFSNWRANKNQKELGSIDEDKVNEFNDAENEAAQNENTAKELQQNLDRRNELKAKKMNGGLSSSEQKELNGINTYFKEQQKAGNITTTGDVGIQKSIDKKKSRAESLRSTDSYKEGRAEADKKASLDKKVEMWSGRGNTAMARSLMGSTLANNIGFGGIANTGIAKYINNNTGGVLTKDGRSKLKEQVSKIDDDTANIMEQHNKRIQTSQASNETAAATPFHFKRYLEGISGAVGAIGKIKAIANVKKLGRKDLNDSNGEVITANSNKWYSRANAQINAIQSNREIAKNAAVNVNGKDYNKELDRIAGILEAIRDGKADDETIKAFVENGDSLKETVALQQPDIAKDFNKMLDELTKARNYGAGTAERDAAMNNAKIHAQSIETKGGFVKIDQKSLQALMNAIKSGNTKALDDKKYGKTLTEYVSKAIKSATEAAKNMKNDPKQQNKTQELLRELINIMKKK